MTAARDEGVGLRADTGTAAEQPALSFAGLLRLLRSETQLTQEELAEAAGLSPRSVSDLERGINRTARKDTARLLADALKLTEPVKDLFIAAARGRTPPADVLAARQGAQQKTFGAAATHALPRDVASFTGRHAELAQLMAALAAPAAGGGVVAIHAIDGMAGIGKTTLAVHAAHQLAAKFPDGQFFLQLHGHTPGQHPVDPADALASLLLTIGVAAAQIPPGIEARAARWRDHVAGKQVLLLLDDAVGHQQIQPLLPGTAGSLVLITSRRRLAALPDAAVISLGTLTPGEALSLLSRLAATPGRHADDAAARDITQLCGYLPLAIAILASQLRHHPSWTEASLVAELAQTRDRLAAMRAEHLSVSAAFTLSYRDLAPGPQLLFRRLGLVPGPSFDALAAAALDGTTISAARGHLAELYDHHLIEEPTVGRFRLHDLLREHARSLADADDPADSDAAIGRLLDYYLATALAAGRHIPAWTAVQDDRPTGSQQIRMPQLGSLAEAAAWLDAERPNLHAAAHYAAAGERHVHAVQIPAAVGDFLRAHGDWEQAAVLHRTALASAQRAADRPGQARALTQLAILQQLTGDCLAAAAAYQQAITLFLEMADWRSLAQVHTQLGSLHCVTGNYPAATASHEQAMNVARAIDDRPGQAHAINCMGVVQRLTGDYEAAARNHRQALAMFLDVDHRLGQSWALHDLGMVQLETGDYPAAIASLQHALSLFRGLGHKLGAANALAALGLAQVETGDYPAAAASDAQTLVMYRELGSRPGEAEMLNNLGDLAARMADPDAADEYHTQALAVARDIGMPLQEARALEGIGRTHVRDDDNRPAMDRLRQALKIYQRIGSPWAARVDDILRRYEHHSESPD